MLLDIDHSPRNLLHARHAGFSKLPDYVNLSFIFTLGGFFALWSDDPPDELFLATLRDVFDTADAHIVSFNDPPLKLYSVSTVYVARTR